MEVSREFSVFVSTCCYMFCSSLMLVVNKLTMHFIPTPALVLSTQLAFASGSILVAAKVFHCIKIDDFSASQLLHFAPYVAAFILCLYSNGKTLEHANVETIIVFRSCSPLLVSIMDWAFLGRQFPSLRSAFALVLLIVSALGYVQQDGQFLLQGISAYYWAMLYLLTVVLEMVYGKHILSGLQLSSPVWSAALCTNGLSVLPMLSLAALAGEPRKLAGGAGMQAAGLGLLACSCALGIGIAWTTWDCRNKVSATTFTLIGVSCKLLTVLINALIWDKHASAAGMAWLLLVLTASTMYEQAPLRQEPLKDAPAWRCQSYTFEAAAGTQGQAAQECQGPGASGALGGEAPGTLGA